MRSSRRVPRTRGTGSAAALRALLRRSAGKGGRLRFDRYVDLAAYAPGLGYYARAGRRLGRAGDFYTAAHVHPLFGATVARRVRAEWDRLGRRRPLRIVELGPGDGTLGSDLLAALARSLPSDAAGEYVYVERSEPLRKRVAERLRRTAVPPGFRVRPMASVGAEGVFDGIVIANELFDALPFRRFRRGSDGWQELYVDVRGRSYRLVGLPVEEGPTLPAAAPEGAELELPSQMHALLREIADHLGRGVLLVLDYGDEEDALLTRRGGSTVGIESHHPVDALARPGEVDVSAFVNFTRLRAAAGRAGLVERAYRPQAEALGAWGIEEELATLTTEGASSIEAVRARLAMKNLLFGFPTFRVLELGPGSETGGG